MENTHDTDDWGEEMDALNTVIPIICFLDLLSGEA